MTLASQFYRCLSEDELAHPSEDLWPGLSVLRETLSDDQCCGGMAWNDRSAVLSKAAEFIKARLLFPGRWMP